MKAVLLSQMPSPLKQYRICFFIEPERVICENKKVLSSYIKNGRHGQNNCPGKVFYDP